MLIGTRSIAGFGNLSNNSQTQNQSNDNNTGRRQLNKLWKKLANNKARLVFLLKNRRQGITPKFIRDKVQHLLRKYENNRIPNKVKTESSKLATTIQKSLINMEISICNKEIEFLKNTIEQLESSNQCGAELGEPTNFLTHFGTIK